MADRLTKMARGQECYVRLPDCYPGPENETVVFAHVRIIGVSGGGLKAPSILGCPACHNCHSLVDARSYMANLTRDDVQLAHLRGVMRWQSKLLKEGVIRA